MDCDDSDPAQRPGGPETCNGLDDNCNAAVDEDTGMTCGDGETCVEGECICRPDRLDCGECADPRSDPRHCGACDVRCGPGNECVNGVCNCGLGQALCDSGCADLDSDAFNCGACATVCPDSTPCVGGACVCPIGTACGPSCVDVLTDRANCGGCGALCRDEPREECVGGGCQSCGGAGMPCCPGIPRCQAGICGGDELCTSCPIAAGTGAPCCYRVEDPDSSFLEFRVAGLSPEWPPAFANAAIAGLLQGGIDDNRLNFVFVLDSRAAPVVQIGPGEVVSGASVAFRMLDAASLDATVAGTHWSATAASHPLQFDLQEADGSTTLSLPLDQVELPGLDVTEEGRCVGARRSRTWIYGGIIEARILLGRAGAAAFPALGITLCELIAGNACEGSPSTWMTPPDHIDPVPDDSYWIFRARFAAASTAIEGIP
ncbi:MAG: hypothetical protein IT379_14800 [Deltaproteobacteria bacterium]|nr:hypothetical protein [Deltaproteobacteria bacterium]